VLSAYVYTTKVTAGELSGAPAGVYLVSDLITLDASEEIGTYLYEFNVDDGLF
jgi:hypothetical protein